jgi:hypothetical protein
MGSIVSIQKISAQKIGITYESYLEKLSKGLKWCMKCRTWKTRDNFSIDKSRGDGLNASCFSCRRVKIKTYGRGTRTSSWKGKTMPQSAKDKMSIAHQGEKNHRWKGGVKSYKANKNQILARRKVNHEIEAGRIPSPKTLKCNDCDNKAKEYHHIKGYEKKYWLTIIPVCFKCHRIRDKSL